MKNILFIAVLLFGTFAIGQKFPTGIQTGPMTTTQINAISSPQEGRLIGNSTTGTIWYYDGSQWVDTGQGITDGDKGDITVSSSGSTFTIDNAVVTEAKLNTSVNASLDLADSAIQPADLNGYVTTSTTQTISGVKTFSGNSLFSGTTSFANNVSTTAASDINFQNSDILLAGDLLEANKNTIITAGGDPTGQASILFNPNGTLFALTATPTDITYNGTSLLGSSGDLWSDPVDADIVPDGVTRSIGSGTNYFANFFIDNIRAYTPNPFIDMRDTNNANNEGFRFGPWANGQDLLLEFLDDVNGVTSTYTINASGTPTNATDLIDKAYADANYAGGDPDQTLSLSGTGNKDLTISGTGGNTVTLPTLANSNQTVASGNRDVQMGITAQLNFLNNAGTNVMNIQGAATRPNFPNNISVSAPTQSDDAIRLQDAETMQQYYVIQNATSDIINNTDFNAAKLYKSLFYRNIDTLIAGDGVTFATHGNKPVMVQPTTKDSTYIKKADGVDFYVAGQTAAITGDGLIVKNRNTAVGYKEGADAWYWSGDLTVHTEVTAIEAFGFDYDFNANGLSLGALASWTNSGGGLATEAAQATSGEQPTVIDESGIRAVQFDGVDDNLEITSQTDLNPVIGTGSGTIIVVVGADNGTDGTWFGDRNTVRNINIGLSNSATQTIIQIGEGAQVFDNISPSGAYIYEVSFDATTIDTYLNGVAELSGDTTIGSDQAQQPFHIGRRVNGDEPFDGSIRRILVKFGAQLTPAERTAIVAQLTSENL